MRTTCSDEMFATPLTAWPATRVKSGPPPLKATRRRGSAIGAAALLGRGLGAGRRRLGGARIGGGAHPAGDDQAGDEPGDEEHERTASGVASWRSDVS